MEIKFIIFSYKKGGTSQGPCENSAYHTEVINSVVP